MASGGAEEDDGGIPLDIDNVHMLLQVEHEQIQKRTFTNWINAQLAKRCPPSFVSDLFSDIRDGSQLLDLIEVVSGQPMKRQRGRGVFQQRANIETALSFLMKKSIKLVNINISDIIDGRPSIILGLVWTIILHCHLEELASTLSFSSCHSSLDSLASLDSWSDSPAPASPVPGRTSPLHRRFRVSAKKALLMWVRDQCKRVGCSVNVRDFKSSWRSGEAFAAILCSLRPHLVDLSLVRSRSNQENLEEVFHLAERELHIPRLLEPQDVDVKDPEEKSIITYVAQFLQYSTDMPAPDDHLQLFPPVSPVNLPPHFAPAAPASPLPQVSQSERALELTRWLQQAHQQLLESWAAAQKATFAEKYQVFHNLADSFTERRRPVMTFLAAIRRRPQLSQEQSALRTAWDRLEEELQSCKADLDSSLPPPLDSVVVWLQRAEAGLTEEGAGEKNHKDAAKEARAQQDTLKTIIKKMKHYTSVLETYKNMDDSGNSVVPPKQFDEIKRRFTDIRVAAKYQGIRLEYRESRHTVLDLLGRVRVKVQTWKAPYRSQETVLVLLQDWHETVERHGLPLILMDALQTLRDRVTIYSSKAALSEDSQSVTREAKAVENEVEKVTQAVTAVRATMERVASAWETYNDCTALLHTWLTQRAHQLTECPAAGTQDMSQWTSCQAKLNEAGNLLIEMTEPSTSVALAEQLSRVNMQWAECMKKAVFEAPSEPGVSLQMGRSLTQEAGRQPLEASSVPLQGNRQKLQLLGQKMADVDLSSLSSFSDSEKIHTESDQQTLPQMRAGAERSCGELQKAVSRLEGRLAELDHWSTEALDCHQHLRERKHRGCSALEPTAKVLVSRGLQLESQVVTEGQDLQDLVAGVEKKSPLLCSLQDRMTEAVCRCQEILELFQAQRKSDAGIFVVVRTKHVDQVGSVVLRTQSASPSQTPQQSGRVPQNQQLNAEKEATFATPHVQIQMLLQPLAEQATQFHSSLAQTVKEAELRPIQSQTSSQSEKRPAGVKEEKESSETHRTRRRPNALQSPKASPQPPAMSHAEVQSKAQSMAKSRLEKARLRLQGRIQQAIKMFGGREISESQAKKKQRALKTLQPSVLDEFLGAVEGFGAFCTGTQLQDLVLLSDSVRKQWEDVRREMAAFVPILRSKIREGKRSVSVVQCETQTNAQHKTTDQTDLEPALQPQVIMDGAASSEEHVESLQELCGTLTCPATEELRESEAPETQQGDTDDCRGRQLRGGDPLRATGTPADTQEQSADSPQQQRLSPAGSQVSAQGGGEILRGRERDAAAWNEDDLAPRGGSGSGNDREQQPLTSRLQHKRESRQQTQTQADVRGGTVESKQAEWTATPPQEEQSSQQEVLERYRKSCSTNKQHLEESIPKPTAISTLQEQKKELQTGQDTEVLRAKFESMSRNNQDENERGREQLTQQWRDQQMSPQSRMATAGKTADLMMSAEAQMALITEKLGPMDVSSFTLSDPRLLSDLKELDDRLQRETGQISERGTEEETRGPGATSPSPPCPALQQSVHHLQQPGQQLETVQSAEQALDHFLATAREVKAEIPALLANQNPSRQQNEAGCEQERHSWQAAVQQKLQTAAEQSNSDDSFLKAVGITPSMGEATVTCQDVVTSLSQKAVDLEKELVRCWKMERKVEQFPTGTERIQENEELHPVAIRQKKTGADSPEEPEHPAPNGMEDEPEMEAKRTRQEGDDTKTQREEQHTADARGNEEDVLEAKSQRTRSNLRNKEGGETESLVQRRADLLGTLREIQGSAELLGLQEPSLPALLQRTRALTELQTHLAGHLAELQRMKDASSPDESREAEGVWEEATKSLAERLERCHVLTELLKRFQSIRGELSGKLQRAEGTISERASYMGKDNLHRLLIKVQETKAELHGLGDTIEDVRGVCRQLHSHLRQIPQCTAVPFEGEADALMDRWLDISERTDSHIEHLQLGLTLWDGVVQLGAEVESWTANKLMAFAQAPSFQTEEDISAVQNEIGIHEENIECFQRRASEIQALLQSTEPLLELQVGETQMRKNMEQLKELVSEAADVYRQMVAAKGQISARMSECFSSLQKIQESLVTLSGSDVPAVLKNLKDLLFELQIQDEEAENLLQGLTVLASITSWSNLQSLSEDGIQLQDKVRHSHQLLSEVEEQTERDIQALDRLQSESKQFEQWLLTVEARLAEKEDLRLLHEEALHQSETTKALARFVSSLQSGPLQHCALLEESNKLLERYNNFRISVGRTEKQNVLSSDVFQAPPTSTRPRDPSRDAESPLWENYEQEVHRSQAFVNETALEEEEIEDYRNNLTQCDGDGLKQDGQLRHSVLQTDSELSTSYQSQRQQACCRLEELKHRIAQLASSSFQQPGTAERRHICILARRLLDDAESLQITVTDLAAQRSDTIRKDSCSDELHDCCSALMAELKDVCSRLEEGVCNEEHLGQLLQDCHHKLTSLQENMSVCRVQTESSAEQITDVPVLEVVILKESATAGAQATVSQEVHNLQNLKRASEGSISQALISQSNHRVQQVEEEVSCAQPALKDLDCETRLTELSAREHHVQMAASSSTTEEETLPAVALTFEAVIEDLDSFRSTVVQKKQESDAERVKQLIVRLQQWNQTVRAEPSAPVSQEAQHEALCLRRALRDVLSEQDSLLNSLGAEESKKLKESASDALNESERALEAASQYLELDKENGSGSDPLAMRPLVSPPFSATDNEENSKCKEDASVSDQLQCAESIAAFSGLTPLNIKSGSSGYRTLSGNKTEPLMSDWLPCPKNGLIAQRETTASTKDCRLSATGTDNTKEMVKPDDSPTDGVSEHPAAKSETFKTSADHLCRLVRNKVSSSVCDTPKHDKSDAAESPRRPRAPKLWDTKLRDAESPEKTSALSATSSPESHRTDTESALNAAGAVDLLSGLKEVKQSCTGSSEVCEFMHSDASRGCIHECQLAGAQTIPDVKQEETTDARHAEEQTRSSALCALEAEARTETQTPAGDAVQSEAAGTRHVETAEEENTEGGSEPQRTQSAGKQIQASMEPEMPPPGFTADRRAGEATGGSPESSMQGILSDIQSLVERSNIINRTPQIDLNWYLKFSPGEPEIHLVRTVQKVLVCRYQPARLDVTAMAAQLQEAEDFRHCVQEQVAAMKSSSVHRMFDPVALKRVEAQWRAALLDASATVQVKAAQLDQVKQYDRQGRIIRAFLDVLTAEMEKTSLNTLGSSALQADKLHVLLQTLRQKKGLVEELLRLSSQLSVHLSDAESSGALLAQLGDIQEEWRLLEGSVKRALQHASNSTSHCSFLIKEAEQLKVKINALQTLIFEIQDTRSALELVPLAADLKLYNQLHLHLQSQSDALVHFSLGQKEKQEIKRSLQDLGMLLNDTKSNLHTFYRPGDTPSAKLNKKLQDLILLAKQEENHITTLKKLALFPEEARIQIAEITKFQTDFCSKMQVKVDQMKHLFSDTEKEECDQVLQKIEDQYKAVGDSLECVLDNMKKNLYEREELLSQLACMDAWLAETHAKRDPCTHVDNVSKADIRKLERKLKTHKSATAEIESQIKLLETMMERCREIAVGLSPGERRYLVNRLSGLWTELDGLLAQEKATSWELEELLHERTSSNDELSTIQTSLHKISTDLEQSRFPITPEAISTTQLMKHMLMEHRCQVQELQHCQEAKRSSLLCTIEELQDQCKALCVSAFEQDKYLHLMRQMEESRDIAREQIQCAKDKTVSMGKRFRLCQTLLVELPLVKTQCQEAADQLEAIAQELYPSELHSERQRIHQTVETLVSWEYSVTEDIRNLEAKLLLGLRFSSELPALMQFFQKTKKELEEAGPVDPDEKAIDIALRRYWVIWRNLESGMRVLEGLGQKEKINLKNHKELYSLKDATKKECHTWMESLSQARESLKDYQWAAQGAIGFLHNAEATFLSAPGGFLDCTEEQRQTQQALEALEDGFQAHISHLTDLLPQQRCLSRPKTEQLHIAILSQLLVGRATLEAQAQLRLESLQRCEVRQQSHRKCHEDVCQHLSGLESKLSDCGAQQVVSHDKCVAQQKGAKLLMEDLRKVAGKMEELRAGCPMQGCGVGKDGELGALWRRWVSLRRGIGLLMAHTQQRREEWKDITTSMEQCCSYLASFQDDVPDSATIGFAVEKPQELLAQAEMHQAGLEQEQQALASLEHRLEHALSLSSSQDPISPGPIGKTLEKIQENVRSLKERNLQVVAAAQAEEIERQQVHEEIREMEQHIFTILLSLETCSNPWKRQELRKDLSSQKAELERITVHIQSRYSEIPADIRRKLEEVQLSLQREEEKLMEKGNAVQKLDSQVVELGSGLEKVKELLEQRSPTISEAQRVLKHAWDELDGWHSRLMLLEHEVQDLAENHPDQAHLLMDQLTHPLQLYQNAAQMAEQRTAFLSKIPACLQEFEGIVYSATCWLDEAESWLKAPCCFTTARSLQNHANSLELVLDDSERIRHALQDFRLVLNEISAVCDVNTQEEMLDQNDQQVCRMQRMILEPLEQLLQAFGEVEAVEAELKTIEKNFPKIKTILSSLDNSDISLAEHLHNRQVILANMQSMRRTLQEMERCRGELHLPQGAEESLLIFSRAKALLQPLGELEQLTQQQAQLLENKIREEDAATVPPEQQKQQQHGHIVQEAFEVCNSEEEEDEENESCHSSSSDTLTCSIPEDPEETLCLDVQSEDIAEIKSEVQELERLTGRTYSEAASTTKDGETPFPSVNCGLGSDPGLLTMDGEAARPEAVTASKPDQPKQETLVPDPPLKSHPAASEEPRLIPARPKTPFTATRAPELREEQDGDVSPPAARCPDPVSLSSVLVEESQQVLQKSEAPTRSTGCEDEDQQFRWSRLHTQISQKMSRLKNITEKLRRAPGSEDGATQEKFPGMEPKPTGSANAVLRRTRDSIVAMRHILSSAEHSHTLDEELCQAVPRVILCLDALTDFLLAPGEEDEQLRLLQQECVATELWTLAELLGQVGSESRPGRSAEEAEALSCLSSLQDCLHAVQLVFTSHSLTHRQRFFSNQLRILDKPEQTEMFPSIADAPSLEQCVLGKHLRESPGKKARVQHASQSLLQGITRLLELGEECITEGQMSSVHSRGQLQAVLCRRQKLLRILRSQLAFVQDLFQREPEALQCQEDERVQLEVGVKALQQQALEQEVASQRGIQVRTHWEDDCGRLGRKLDDLEAFISSGQSEGDEEKAAQQRLDAWQQTLVQLEESRAALGLILDQGKVLGTEPEFAATVNQAGGALELRWESAYRRTEDEIQRCKDIQDSRVRFQADLDLVSKWMIGANKCLKTLSNLANTSDLNQECVHSHLIKLLDFSMETEAMSVMRASVTREATHLLHLREADCPGLRAQLDQLEVKWSQLTSDLSKIQEQLQQRLLAAWPPLKLLSDLEDCLKELETRLSQDKETVLKARDAAQLTAVLQHLQELKAGVANGQLLLDFLSQPGPRVVGADVQALHQERTGFSEMIGALRLKWIHLQMELEIQIRDAEQMRWTCAGRERRLRRLHGWIERQKKKMSQQKQPTGRTLAQKTLLEMEAIEDRVNEVSTSLEGLKLTQAVAERKEGHPCDISFSGETESVCHGLGELSQQMAALRPALQQTVDQWGCFQRDLREVSLHTTRVHCSLQHQPLFSLKQAEGYLDLLQLLQEQVGKGEELWASMDGSFQSVAKTLRHGTTEALSNQIEAERKRWKDVVQEFKDEHRRTGEALSLWQEYARLSDGCLRHLTGLQRQWEELKRSSPQQDSEPMIRSVELLQEAAGDLQISVGDVLAASKPLIGRLEPVAANLIQSDTRLLSRDVLLLSQALSARKRRLQEDLEQKKLFHTQLEVLETQTQNIQSKLQSHLSDANSAQVVLELSGLFASLVDVRASLNQQPERVHMLCRQWVQSMTHVCDVNRELQAEHHRSHTFEEKCQSLASIEKKLEQELTFKTPQSYANLQEMLSVQKRLEAETIIGQQLLQLLLCQAVDLVQNETAEKRSELVAKVTSVKQSWLGSVSRFDQCQSLIKQSLQLWTVYHRGGKVLWKLLRDVECFLAPAGPAGPASCSLHHTRSCSDGYQCVRDALGRHASVYAQTLEAAGRLCDAVKEPECQRGLRSDVQALQEAWERSSSLLETRRNLVDTCVQKWSQCQDSITSITAELDQLETRLEQRRPEGQQDAEDENLNQETELSLQRLATGLRELATMKTDLSQYVTTGDSALLEQQLEQLHGQWEELCIKVSLRRQEIADRLNAWTIFNDKNKEFCDWLTQMENKVCHSGDLSIEDMVEKLKKDCMEEINLFSENKSHLKQLGEQLLMASDQAKQTQVHGSLLEANQRWHNLFHHIEARVKKLKETLVTVQQLDKNMSNLRSWLSRIETELSRPITYSVCHHQEIQRRLVEQQELQRDIEQHTEGVASVLSLCDVLLRDEDAAGGTETEGDSLQETSRSLDQRWRTICALALDRRLRIEETWRLWCKFLDDYSRFEDWLKITERTAANPNSADVLYTVAKEELKKFEGFQRQVHERLTQLELVNNQYRRLARENRTDRASQLKAMVHEGNRRWDTLHRRVAAILRRLKYFTSQREEFEGTRESMLVWLTELDLQLTNVEHFSESDVHHKIQQLNSFQKEITLNTERIDGLIVFGEGLIQKSSPQDAALIEDELEELHSYCQEVFSRLVRFHQRLSQPPLIKEEPELWSATFSLESSLELIGRPWLGRSQGSLPATPTHLLATPLERSGRETPVSVDSLPLEWDHTGDVGGSSSHEDDDDADEKEVEEDDDERTYFSALSAVHNAPRWRLQEDTETPPEAPPTLTSTPLKQGYARLMSQCCGSIEDIKRVSLILDDDEQPEEVGLTGLTASDKQSGVIERWELLQAQPGSSRHAGPQEPQRHNMDHITSWLEDVIPELESLQRPEPAVSIEDMAARAKHLKEMQKTFARYKSLILSVNLRAQEAPELQQSLAAVNRDWSRACTGLQQWEAGLKKTLIRCQEFHQTLHSLLLWLAHAESRRYAVDTAHPDTPVRALRQHRSTLTELRDELQARKTQQASLLAVWSQLQPEEEAKESDEVQEKLHVTGSKLKLLLRQVDQDLSILQQRLECHSAPLVREQSASADVSQEAAGSKKVSSAQRDREPSPPRSLFYRVLRAAFPLHLLLLFLLLLPCLIPQSESDPGCTGTNNFARSFYPMLHYTNGPPPT